MEKVESESLFYGTWKIVECVSLAGTVEPTGIEGTEFHLDECGDVTWKVPDGAESMPFFYCETYELIRVFSRTKVSVLRTRERRDRANVVLQHRGLLPRLKLQSSFNSTQISLGGFVTLKFFGAFAGHVIEFTVEMSDDLMLLTYECCCMLQCQKVSTNDLKGETSFCFLPALEEGYFSDTTIKSESDKKFAVHSTLLSMGAPTIDWRVSPTPLCGLPDPVVHTILHYLYAECLPKGLSEETARQVYDATQKMPEFSKLSQLCETFLKNTALRQQIVSLVTDMHACADKVIELFTGKVDGSVDTLTSNPAKLCYVIKQAIREAAVAGAKLLILCDLFSRRKGDLSREERYEIIMYAKSRLPIFMKQLRQLLELVKQHTAALSAAQRLEIATYMVPELKIIKNSRVVIYTDDTIIINDNLKGLQADIETSLELVSKFVIESKTALEHVINVSHPPDKAAKGHVSDVLGRTLRNALHMREIKKLRKFHEKTTQSIMELRQKKERFSLLSQEGKIRSIDRNFDQAIDDVPLFLVRVEELMSNLDERVTWREWKYFFKFGTSKVAWALNKIQTHRSTLGSLIQQAIDMVHRDQFTSSLSALGLTDPPSGAPEPASSVNTAKSTVPTTKYAQLSAVESLCKPPYARDSQLAKASLELLRLGEGTDMVFEIICVQEGGDVVVDHTQGEPYSRADREKEVDLHKVPAHCVVIAARCDWFRRALLSGMREAIDKRITVHDTSPVLFRHFIEYLYSGQLTVTELTTEQLADMMALADRYEMDSLMTVCELSLKQLVDEDSVLFLIGVADQYHARTLKEAALTFVMDHPTIVDSDVFEDLPEYLQTEVEEMVSWHGLDPRGRHLGAHSHTETPSTVSSNSEMDDFLGGLHLRDKTDQSGSSSSDDGLQVMEDGQRLETCLTFLRDVVGDAVPREDLVQVALAADYDANRAINYYFSL